jgi:hypothetical protein
MLDNWKLYENEKSELITNPNINLAIKLVTMDPPGTSLSNVLQIVIIQLRNNVYSTIESLQNILIEINKLPIECLTGDNECYVYRIKKTIEAFNGPGKLTGKQRYRLIRVFKDCCELIEYKIQPPKPMSSHESYSSDTTRLIDNNYDFGVIKLTEDNDLVISQVIFSFIVDLSRDVMTSTLNIVVLEYFETMESLLLENSERYSDIANEISSCLIKYGWERGFTKEPKTKDMVLDLQNIVNKYF